MLMWRDDLLRSAFSCVADCASVVKMNSTEWEGLCATNWTVDCQAGENPDNYLYEVPTAMVVLLSICYGAISVVAVVGNSLVIWIIVSSRRMQRSATNCFIANLAMADIAIGLFSVPFQFQAALLQRWNLPEFMCAFCPFVQVRQKAINGIQILHEFSNKTLFFLLKSSNFNFGFDIFFKFQLHKIVKN